jgi:hypothetical protein
LKRAADPEAGRDMHNQVLFGKKRFKYYRGLSHAI